MNSTTRTTDSNGYFIEHVVPTVPTVESPVDVSKERIVKRRLQAIIDASNRRRILQAKKIQYTASALQAIDYLLGDKYRDKRTSQQKADDTLANSLTGSAFLAYLDNARQQWINTILGDRETVQTMQNWMLNYSDSNVSDIILHCPVGYGMLSE